MVLMHLEPQNIDLGILRAQVHPCSGGAAWGLRMEEKWGQQQRKCLAALEGTALTFIH